MAPPRVEQVEQVRRLQHVVVGRQDERLALPAPRGEQSRHGGFHILEFALEHGNVGELEFKGGKLPFIFQEHVAIGLVIGALRVVEFKIVDVVDALHIERHSLQTVGNFARDGKDIQPADLLKVGVLADLHPVAPDFPTQAPRADRWILPVVLDEADIVQLGIDAHGREGSEVESLHVWRARLQNDLILMKGSQAIGIFSIAPVGRPAVRVEHRRRATAWVRARAGRSPDEACPHRPRRHKVAGSRNLEHSSRRGARV